MDEWCIDYDVRDNDVIATVIFFSFNLKVVSFGHVINHRKPLQLSPPTTYFRLQVELNLTLIVNVSSMNHPYLLLIRVVPI